jgi:hypothetical protein
MVCAFEVEKSTPIYSGILRLADLAIALPDEQIRICLLFPDLVKQTRDALSGEDPGILDKIVKKVGPLT